MDIIKINIRETAVKIPTKFELVREGFIYRILWKQ
jgi:hypothetical protein